MAAGAVSTRTTTRRCFNTCRMPTTTPCSTPRPPTSPPARWRCARYFSIGKSDPTWGRHVERALNYLYREQEADGCWFGTVGRQLSVWHVAGAARPGAYRRGYAVRAHSAGGEVAALRAERGRRLGRNLRVLRSRHPKANGPSTPSQTAWALMGLLNAGDLDSRAVQARPGLPAAQPGRAWNVGRGVVHGNRLSPRLLPALPLLPALLPALGAGAVPYLRDGRTLRRPGQRQSAWGAVRQSGSVREALGIRHQALEEYTAERLARLASEQ